MFQKLVDQLAEELAIALPKRALRERTQMFPLRKDLVLSLLDLDPGFGMQGDIGPSPEKGREEFLLSFMRANLLGQGTGGSRLGMKDDEKTLTLSLGLPYELSYGELREKVEEFVNYLTYWREELDQLKKREPAEGL